MGPLTLNSAVIFSCGPHVAPPPFAATEGVPSRPREPNGYFT
jgi:hypothetical protein